MVQKLADTRNTPFVLVTKIDHPQRPLYLYPSREMFILSAIKDGVVEWTPLPTRTQEELLEKNPDVVPLNLSVGQDKDQRWLQGHGCDNTVHEWLALPMGGIYMK